MKYNTETGQSYSIPKYEIIRLVMLENKDQYLTMRQLKMLTGIKRNTIRYYLEMAIELGFVKLEVLIRDKKTNRPRINIYKIKTNRYWHSMREQYERLLVKQGKKLPQDRETKPYYTLHT